MIERLPGQAAIQRIRNHRERNELVLGVDGFRTVPGGNMASLDLILDLSTERLSVTDAAAQAEAFVMANAADDVTFEVVA
jgi:hypothetical protein